MTTRQDFERSPAAAQDRAVILAVAGFIVCTLLGTLAAALIGAASDGGAVYLTIQPGPEEDSSFNWLLQLLGALAGVISASVLYVGMMIVEQVRIHRIPGAASTIGGAP